MMKTHIRHAGFALLFLVALASPSRADPPPPANGKPLTEILRQIEAQAGFRYFDEVDWDDGVYKIEYHMQDGTKREVRIDPVTGAQR
jgi:hypothetical protein